MQFNNPQELDTWLAIQGIDLTHWGQGKAKTVRHLWRELQQEDAVLAQDPLRRVIHVVQVIVERNGLVLIEANQELHDGRYRERNRPPAEKMKVGEAVVAATYRCLHEELGVAAERVTLLSVEPEILVEERPSQSYPGLCTQYTFYKMHATIIGLPDIDFWHDNLVQGPEDPIKRHHWVWIKR